MGVTFYATISAPEPRRAMLPYWPHGVSVLLSAASFQRERFRVPVLPDHVTDRAADSGGFVASFRWGGEYRYTPAQYVTWLLAWRPRWAATMDYCCEDEITAGRPGLVAERQERTTENAWRLWERSREVSWCWVPTVQGWRIPDDYVRHAEALRPLVREQAAYYAQRGQGGTWRVGIGTLCRRASAQDIRRVVLALSDVLPGVRFHLWGVKLGLLKQRQALPACVTSVDSAAWDGVLGTHGEAGDKWRVWRDRGWKQGQYKLAIALPEYLAKIDAAREAPKQLNLLEA